MNNAQFSLAGIGNFTRTEWTEDHINTMVAATYDDWNTAPKPVNNKTNVFAGKTVAFTGTLKSGNRKMQRSEAQQSSFSA